MILKEYDLQRSLNFFDRQYLAKFYDIFKKSKQNDLIKIVDNTLFFDKATIK